MKKVLILLVLCAMLVALAAACVEEALPTETSDKPVSGGNAQSADIHQETRINSNGDIIPVETRTPSGGNLNP